MTESHTRGLLAEVDATGDEGLSASDVHAAYRSAAAIRLDDGDARLSNALSSWRTFVERQHGPVFEESDVDDLVADSPNSPRTARAVFCDSLAYDFLVARVLRRFEDAFDLSLRHSDPTAERDLLPFALDDLHARVASDLDATTRDWFAAIDHETLLATDPTALGDHYEGVVPRKTRLAFGEYYTPRGVADLALPDAVADPSTTVLDPGCGAGVFLVAAIDRKRRTHSGTPTDLVEHVTDTVFGIDLNPVAVRSATLAYLLALAPVLVEADCSTLSVPVAFGDALALTDDTPVHDGDAFVPAVDLLVGNPPWVTWDRLAPAVRERWRRRYVDSLDLLPQRGPTSLLGYANDDLSVPFVWVCVDRYLREGGYLGVVLKRDHLTAPAGRLFRGLHVGDRPMRLDAVEDFADLRPFGLQVGADAAVYRLTADAEPSFPVSMRRWAHGDGVDAVAPDFTSIDGMTRTLATTETELLPVDPDDIAGSWVTADAERRALGTCAYEIRHGVKDDAKAVFAVDRETLAALEPDHVFPYLKSRHLVKYGLFGYDLQLVPMRQAVEDNEVALARTCPRTYAYLQEHREQLTARSSSWFDQGPFYALFGLGPYTWADYKVVWCRLGFKPHFTVVSTVDDADLGEKPVVPGDHCMFISTDDAREAHYLCALLNSGPYQRCLRDVASDGKSSLSKSVVSQLSLPQYTGTDVQRRLAALSQEAHGVVPEHTDVSKRTYNRTSIPALATVQAEIDRLVESVLAERENGNS